MKRKAKADLLKEAEQLQRRIGELEAATKPERAEWFLQRSLEPASVRRARREFYSPPYGDLTKLNTCRVILDAIGGELLADIAGDYLDLLDTSAGVYEANGDYALGIFSSGWCQLLDRAARAVCDTDDDREALNGGTWHCHESCWTEASKASIEKREPVDIECKGGIRLYAVPVKAGDEIVGSMNVGYGDPPKDPEKLEEIAEAYRVDVGQLRQLAAAYETRPHFIIESAKARLRTSARLVGAIVESKRAEAEMTELSKSLERRVLERTEELRRAVNLMAGREVRMAEQKEVIQQLRAQLAEGGMPPGADDPLKTDGGVSRS